MSINTCDYCGRPDSATLISEGAWMCATCFSYCNTCTMCETAQFCPFETDPSPLPKVVLQTTQRGPMTVQTQVKNPARVQQFCFPCKCFNQDELYCRREEGWCKSYEEITPRFRQQRFETT